ncbi:MAG: hypothetical protein ACJAVM_000450 [Sulfitobacter sp.]|jgi:hypothetical protein
MADNQTNPALMNRVHVTGVLQNSFSFTEQDSTTERTIKAIWRNETGRFDSQPAQFQRQ